MRFAPDDSRGFVTAANYRGAQVISAMVLAGGRTGCDYRKEPTSDCADFRDFLTHFAC